MTGNRKEMQENFDKARKALQMHEGDTGSSSIQVVGLTEEIELLTQHLGVNKKDYPCRRSLLKKVAARKTHLKYLKKINEEQYKAVISTLGLKR